MRQVEPDALPNYEKAEIPSDKLEKYALDPTHPVGKHKARVFESVLGINQSDWRVLANSIQNELPYNKARPTKSDSFGQRYEVIMPITGPNGKTENVLTAWIVKADSDYPSLVSLYIQKRD